MELLGGHIAGEHPERSDATAAEPAEATERKERNRSKHKDAALPLLRRRCESSRLGETEEEDGGDCEPRDAYAREEPREPPVIRARHASAHPRTVVIEALEATLADRAVRCARRFPEEAGVAPSVGCPIRSLTQHAAPTLRRRRQRFASFRA